MAQHLAGEGADVAQHVAAAHAALEMRCRGFRGDGLGRAVANLPSAGRRWWFWTPGAGSPGPKPSSSCWRRASELGVELWVVRCYSFFSCPKRELSFVLNFFRESFACLISQHKLWLGAKSVITPSTWFEMTSTGTMSIAMKILNVESWDSFNLSF